MLSTLRFTLKIFHYKPFFTLSRRLCYSFKRERTLIAKYSVANKEILD